MDWRSISKAVVSFLPTWWPWLLAGAAVIAVVVGVWGLWWRLPRWQVDRLRSTMPDTKARADVEDNFRKTVGQLLGGAAVLIGAGLAYLQFQGQQQASRNLLISNQVAKGFELLGNKEKDITLRLGGIYALEGVMNISEDYHRSVLEALCAFVRDQTKAKTGDDAPATDVQAALTVIGRRRVMEGSAPDLNNVLIQKANLIGADLNGARLYRANLPNPNLSGANLPNTNLSGADLAYADLSGARLHDADLSGANLVGASLYHATLYDAHLSGASLIGARFLTQQQLDAACGTDVQLDPGLTIKPCPPQ
jgi:uncharacterized protein YjbI with pentapeptide repeats